MTAVFNVPRNDALAALDAASADGADLWNRYLSSRTLWNDVRTFTAPATSPVPILALSAC